LLSPHLRNKEIIHVAKKGVSWAVKSFGMPLSFS